MACTDHCTQLPYQSSTYALHISCELLGGCRSLGRSTVLPGGCHSMRASSMRRVAGLSAGHGFPGTAAAKADTTAWQRRSRRPGSSTAWLQLQACRPHPEVVAWTTLSPQHLAHVTRASTSAEPRGTLTAVGCRHRVSASIMTGRYRRTCSRSLSFSRSVSPTYGVSI